MNLTSLINLGMFASNFAICEPNATDYAELTSLKATLTLWHLQSVDDHEFQRYL